jgi:hypothetical protein
VGDAVLRTNCAGVSIRPIRPCHSDDGSAGTPAPPQQRMGIKACKPIIDPNDVDVLMDEETRAVLRGRFSEIARGGESFTADDLAAHVRRWPARGPHEQTASLLFRSVGRSSASGAG